MTRAVRAAALLALALWPCAMPAIAAPKEVLVINAGSEAIFELRVRPATATQWGGDLLGFARALGISRGYDVAVDASPPGCLFDVLAVYGDGDVQVRSSVDLCAVARVQFDH